MSLSRCFTPTIACLLAFATLAPLGEANAQDAEPDSAAKVVAVRGTVILRHADGTDEQLRIKSKINVGDIVETGDRGRVQICFEDGSIVSLGKNTTIEITAFKFQSDESEGRLETTVRRGLFRVMGGAITDFAPGNFKTHTPTASIGVRGCYYLGRATPNSTRVALLGSGNIYMENPFGNVDLDSPGETAQADEGTAPRLIDDPDFIRAILGETGVGGEDEDPGDGQDDQPQFEDDAGDGWQQPDEPDGEGGAPDDQEEPEQESEQEQTPQDEAAPRADDIRNEEQQRDQQLQEATQSPPELWNGLAAARDSRGNWFETQSLNDFQVLFETAADAPSGEGALTVVSKQYVPEPPVKPSEVRSDDFTRASEPSVLNLDFRVWGTTPGDIMHLQTNATATDSGTDPAEVAQPSLDTQNGVESATASFAGGTGTAIPFTDGVGADADIPEYMSWGEWNADLHSLNDPSDMREDALKGFWVLGRRTPAKTVEALITSPRNVVGVYRGPAVADRIHAGNTTRYQGSTDLTVEFAQERFWGGFTFPGNGTELQIDVKGTIDIREGISGQARTQWLRGSVTNIVDNQTATGRTVPGNSVVNGAFFGTDHPDAMGGTFRTENGDVRYIGNFIGKKE